MKLIEVHARLKKMAVPVFRTADVMAYLDIRKEHASNLLARLEDTHHIVRIKRGLWVFPEGIDPLAVPEYLTAPFPSYISLQSALYYHGMISQIPAITYSVSPARTHVYKTSLGAGWQVWNQDSDSGKGALRFSLHGTGQVKIVSLSA